jgi:hypothetical protein
VSDDGNGTGAGDGTAGDGTGPSDGAAGDATRDARTPGDPVAGWYPDPDVHGGQRYWDGRRWTDDRRTPGPPAPAPSPTPASSSWGSAGGGATTSWSTGAPAAPIDTWLWQSIVATIFCCQPFGIVAIVYSAMAGTARDLGNLDLARHRAGQARTWTLVSAGTVLVLLLGFFLIAGLGALFSV